MPHQDPPAGPIRVRGARDHNLRDVDVDVPRDAVVVFTGVSGSGKSSLAFGTIYAESQRRYLESVAPYARRLIQQVAAPHVDSVTGVPPAVAVRQNRSGASARSSVGTVTTLSNSLRMLLSRAGDYPAGAPRLDSDAFSPNTAAGACPHCHGVGTEFSVTEGSVVPDPSLSIRDGAVAAWPRGWQGKNFRDVLAALGHDVDVPWRELPRAERDWILFTDEKPVVTVHPVREADRIQRPYRGTWNSVRDHVLTTFASTGSATVKERLRGFLHQTPCPACGGRRLRPEALAVRFAGHDVVELSRLPLQRLVGLLSDLGPGPDGPAAVLVRDLLERASAVVDLGLGYLALERAVPTLSTGELQRLRLATQLRSGLFGVVYVLDEPSAGLHPADTAALREVLAGLRDAGNSVLVVEHDMDVARGADWLVDVGPGAGDGGGRVLHSGPVAGLQDVAESVTREFLAPGRVPATRAPRVPTSWLGVRGASLHNVHDLDVDLPLGVLTAVTGVSGSGKSTLVSGIVADAVARHLDASGASGRAAVGADSTVGGNSGDGADGDGDDPGQDPDEEAVATAARATVGALTGARAVTRLVRVDQRPIGRTPRSNLATYTGLFDAVRAAFAREPEARARHWGASRFSFNVAAGRCPTCRGEGAVSVELLFLPGTWSPCPQCRGSRYAPETLEVTHRGRTIADVLALTVDEACEALDDVPAAVRGLQALRAIGLGYLRLGQPATELSGGEAQRIKLATELQRASVAGTLYLLDEPTTGLHPADVRRLLALLHELVDGGSTVVVVEHDAAVLLAADFLVDLGPGGGDAGGRVVATGTPEEVVRAGTGTTAHHLARHLVPAP
ncbi:excinuclease ABC subunit UvrA [Kineococcus radiotolerans]|uniref:UvrABC system protein A n=1 Tax=Kineococcus radiotolerans (strain ATCC BAA-149 / DSM 14245 / SRS30216) TaxID=266940 RepID=A6W8Y4_KINRD|nr:excinuclease ABC subunit UvrA [Kineococcus radiotolerans]ABS03273.1 ABC transporter related [Kineococcus radiotolerans SRS30216 = ATCC BAA-149]